jgi:hypothetical protein
MSIRVVLGVVLGVILGVSILAIPCGGRAFAAPAVALSDTGAGQQLLSFDTTSPATYTSSSITGTQAGERIVDIDFYPVDGLLYGMGATTANLYRLNPATGLATLDVPPGAPVAGPTDVDFNPAADRLRVFAGANNFRLTPGTFNNAGLSAGAVTSDGPFVFAAGDVNATAAPNLVANAYTSNFDGTAATTLYSIDTGLNALLLHSGGPQFSTLNTVAGLTVSGSPLNVGSSVGFDISPAGTPFVSNGNDLYTLNLATGGLTSLGVIATPNFPVQTIAVAIPEPATVALLLGSLVTIWPLWRKLVRLKRPAGSL